MSVLMEASKEDENKENDVEETQVVGTKEHQRSKKVTPLVKRLTGNVAVEVVVPPRPKARRHHVAKCAMDDMDMEELRVERQQSPDDRVGCVNRGLGVAHAGHGEGDSEVGKVQTNNVVPVHATDTSLNQDDTAFTSHGAICSSDESITLEDTPSPDGNMTPMAENRVDSSPPNKASSMPTSTASISARPRRKRASAFPTATRPAKQPKTQKPSRPATPCYEPHLDDVEEDKIEIIDEDAPIEEDRTAADSGPGDALLNLPRNAGSSEQHDYIPMRFLSDFCFYDRATQYPKTKAKGKKTTKPGTALVRQRPYAYLEDIGAMGKDIVASGVVRACFTENGEDIDIEEAEGEDEEDDGVEETDDASPLDDPKGKGKMKAMPAPMLSTTRRRRREEQRITLSSIFNWTVEHCPITGNCTIWLRTQFAYYKLLQPNPNYKQYYDRDSAKQCVVARLLHILTTYPDVTMTEFLSMSFDALCAKHKAVAVQVGSSGSGSVNSRATKTPDIEDMGKSDYDRAFMKHNASQIMLEVQEFLFAQDNYFFLDHPLWKSIVSLQPKQGKGGPTIPPAAIQVRDPPKRIQAAKNMNVNVERTSATVTPWIENLSRNLFRRHVTATKDLLVDAESSASNEVGNVEHEFNEQKRQENEVQKSMEDVVENRVNQDTNDSSTNTASEVVVSLPIVIKGHVLGAPYAKTPTHFYYANARLSDGENASSTDIVAFDPARHPFAKRPFYRDTYTQNAAHPCLATITYFHRRASSSKPGPTPVMVRLRLFLRASVTILEELGDEFEYMLSDHCMSVPISAITKFHRNKRLSVTYCPADATQKPMSDTPEYFFRYWYNTEQPAFEDIDKHTFPPNHVYPSGHLNKIEAKGLCFVSQRMYLEELAKIPIALIAPQCQGALSQDVQANVHGFRFGGECYKILDTVFIGPKAIATTASDANGKAAPVRKLPNRVARIVGVTIQSFLDDKKQDREELGDFKGEHIFPKSQRDDADSDYAEKMVKKMKVQLELFTCPAIHQGLKDPHALLKPGKSTIWVSHDAIVGHARVFAKAPDSRRFQVRFPDAFYVVDDTENTLSLPLPLDTNAKMSTTGTDHPRKLGKKLRALDIFSGCGGLSCGMERTGVVETTHAVEFSASAALTFEQNFPNAHMLNQDANVLLARAIQRKNKQHVDTIKDHLGRTMTHELPAPGAIDFIYCGPPCQGFSGINRFKKADDLKNTLVATSLSYVDHFRPSYFLLENVRGMLAYKLGGEQDGTNRIKGGIKMGMIKYILRALTSMGYQARFGIQQAGHQGLPQSRRRVFVWGTKRGLTLPKMPQPLHVFPKGGSLSIKLPNGTTFTTIEKRQDNNNAFAPLPAVTVQDAIGDLPAFEYIDPHITVPASEADKEADANATIPRKIAVSKGVMGHVGDMVTPHTHAPMTRYQFERRCEPKPQERSGDEGQGLRYDAPGNRTQAYWKRQNVHNHVTRTFNETNVERICQVPMRAGADHHDLPDPLKPWCLSHPDSAASRHNGWKGLYGRLDKDGHFLTALTEISPMGKQGTVLHPEQKRVLTVRECARAQGFPDVFEFKTEKGDVRCMHRQIGNAVPPPLALAMGRELVKALEADGNVIDRQ